MPAKKAIIVVRSLTSDKVIFPNKFAAVVSDVYKTETKASARTGDKTEPPKETVKKA